MKIYQINQLNGPLKRHMEKDDGTKGVWDEWRNGEMEAIGEGHAMELKKDSQHPQPISTPEMKGKVARTI